MASLFRQITRTANFHVLSGIVLILLASGSGSFAQVASTPPSLKVSPHANSATNVSDGKASPVDPRINTTEIVNRVNQDLGLDLEAMITSWQRELDQLESELSRPHLRYSELNGFRDRLQRVRSQVEDTGSRLQPRLQRREPSCRDPAMHN